MLYHFNSIKFDKHISIASVHASRYTICGWYGFAVWLICFEMRDLNKREFLLSKHRKLTGHLSKKKSDRLKEHTPGTPIQNMKGFPSQGCCYEGFFWYVLAFLLDSWTIRVHHLSKHLVFRERTSCSIFSTLIVFFFLTSIPRRKCFTS